jgi:hypothetical protein
VAIAVFGGILLLGFIGVAIWCLRRQKKRDSPNDGYVMPLTLPSSTESGNFFLVLLFGSTSDSIVTFASTYTNTRDNPG